jgi:hypothetical protein
MRNLLLSLLLVAGVSAAQAQTYQPAVARGSVLGAIAGAFVGGHNHNQWAQGAVIGAAAGALLGAVVDDARPQAYYAPPSQVVYTQVGSIGCAPQTACGQAPGVVYVTTPPPAQVVYVQPYAQPVVYVAVGGGYRRHHYGHRW